MDDFYISFKHNQIDNNELEKYVDNMIKELSDLIGLSFNHCKINDNYCHWLISIVILLKQLKANCYTTLNVINSNSH